MSNSSDPKAVVIRIEISVPCPSGTPQVATHVAPAAPCAGSAAPLAMTAAQQRLAPASAPRLLTSISYPKSTSMVRAADGAICAKGIADPDAYGNYPTQVKHLIMDPATPSPDCPSGSDVEYYNNGTGDWCTTALTGAQCGTPEAPVANKLVVYSVYATGECRKKEMFFDGICGNYTDCEIDGIECPTHDERRSSAVAQTWKLSVHGFAGDGLEAFNGDWRLGLAAVGDVPPRWDNGADGVIQPRVELSYCRVARRWRLRFRRGQQTIEYSKPEGAWSCAGINIFTAVAVTHVSPQASLPASIVLAPVLA